MKNSLETTELILIIVLAVLVLVLPFIVSAQTIPPSNDSCSGTLCGIDTSNDTTPGYTYDDNLKDPKCWYNLNFCNAGYNSSSGLTGDAYGLLNLLKQVNYQMQDELNASKTNLSICQSKLSESSITNYVLILIMIFVASLITYMIFRGRKTSSDELKGGNKK